jgi:hypothetical protein
VNWLIVCAFTGVFDDLDCLGSRVAQQSDQKPAQRTPLGLSIIKETVPCGSSFGSSVKSSSSNGGEILCLKKIPYKSERAP